ncbi:ATP-binding protein [Chitinilyticum litopenaei]|uniref:ATP-binding protein n=1 Tax=Chitinilyticum litopenaei TaxID=1121276 RepID=UPI0003FE73B6|nr:ATP-binding protein [Chitinilyticum litopenaei]
MWRLFFRQFFLLLAFLIALVYAWGEVSSVVLNPYFQNHANTLYSGPMQTLTRLLEPAGMANSDAEVRKNMLLLQNEFGAFPIRLYQLEELPAEARPVLRAGQVWFNPDSEHFYRRIGQRELVLSLEPPDPPDMTLINILFVFCVLATLAPCYLLAVVRPFWRDLQKLRHAAGELGAGRLDTRVELKPKSSLYALSSRLNEMAERIEALMRGQNELLNAVAHELRTPLARTRFAVTLQADADPERQASLRQSALDDLEEMETLIRELLGYGRLDARSGPPQREPIPAAIWLAELAQGSAQPHPVALALSAAPATLAADPTLLEHALANLLRNAQRHAHSRITLGCERGAAETLLYVEDDGPGVPPAERERIFEPFVRLDDSRSRDTGGIGLGLAIVKRIVERHGGTVQAEDAQLARQGVRFTIRLPA